jgi:anti-sigma B factor antagonist
MAGSLPRPEFEVFAEPDGDVVLRVSGEIDAAVSPRFRDRLGELLDVSRDDVLVDLADVSFIDSSGLAVLVHAHHQLDGTGRRIVIARSSRTVTRALELAGLRALFDGEDWESP